MKIYTLLLGALFVSPTQAQTMHDWENHHVLQINREPARATFTPFSVQKGDGSISLDGTWKFRWTPVPNERVVNFYQINFDDKDWTDFPVPANWEVNGYGTPIYVSAGYPFKIDPPRVMGEPRTDYTTYKERNPVGHWDYFLWTLFFFRMHCKIVKIALQDKNSRNLVHKLFAVFPADS